VLGNGTFLPSAQAQGPGQEVPEVPYFTFNRGFGVASPDSNFTLHIRFRMQNRVALETVSATDLSISEVEARVRRLRLRFDGHIYSPRLTYVIQLSFSRGDMDYEALNFPNVVRDAMVLYAFNSHFSLGVGQTKLPGNRQRVNSSGDLQFCDRSLVNATFNVDRDFGIQAYYRNHIGKLHYWLRGAITSGEGRNINTSDRGLAYTARIELLPLGTFTNNGDYFEGDLAREPKPKVSVGISYSYNQHATRTGGQLGPLLYQPTDIGTAMVDFLVKWRGFSAAIEHLVRNAPSPVGQNSEGRTNYVYVGHGQNYQAGYLFRRNLEVAVRYTHLAPFAPIKSYQAVIEQFTLGVSRYLKGHRVKLQSDITFEQVHTARTAQNWQWRFQIEMGI
jgi:hypothetical protein